MKSILKSKSSLRAAVLVGSIAALLFPAKGLAADQVWTGLAGDQNVNTPGNWTAGSLDIFGNPVLFSFNPIVFGSGVANGTMQLQPWVTVQGIVVNSGCTTPITINGGWFLFASGAPIDLSAAVVDLTMNVAWMQGWGDISMNVGAGRTLTLNGAVGQEAGWAGGAGLVKNGAGKAVLNAAPITTAWSGNPTPSDGYYTGPTSINAGTLSVTYDGGGNGGIGTLPVGSSITVSSGATLLASGFNALGYGSTHTGDQLTVNEGGSLTIDSGIVASMPYALNVVGGTIASMNGGNPLYGTLYYQSTQGTFTSAGDGTAATISAQRFNLQGASFNVTDGAGAVDLSVTGTLIGNDLVKYGNGFMSLSGTNSYTGATTINAGTLQIAGAGSLGSGSYAGAISIDTVANLRYSSSVDQTFSGVISGAGSLTKDTSGSTLYLSGTNTYTGASTVSAGVLKYAHVAAVGSTSGIAVYGTGSVWFDPGTAGGTVSTPISLSGDGGGNCALNTYTPNGQVTFSGPITMTGSSLIRAIGDNSTLNFTNAIHGTGDFSFAAFGGGAGTKDYIVLSGASDFSGGFALVNWYGAVQATLSGGDNRLPTTALVTVHGGGGLAGALNLNGYNQTIAGLTDTLGFGGLDAGARSVVNTNGTAVTLTLNTTANQSSGVSIGGTDINGTTGNNLALLKIGAATQTLSGVNTYTGATTVSAGKLQFTDTAPNSSASLSIATGATLEFNVSTAPTPIDFAHVQLGALNGTTVTGTGTFVKSGAGVLALDGQGGNHAVTFNMTGGLIDIQGGTLRNGGWSGGIWGSNLASMNVASGAMFDLWGGQSVVVDALTGGGTIDSVFYGSNQTLTVGANGGSGTFSGVFQNTTGSLGLIKTGNGTLSLSSGNNSFTGGLFVTSGTVNVNGDNNGGHTSAGNGMLSISAGATVNATGINALGYGGTAIQGTDIRGTLTLNNAITIEPTINLTGGTISNGNATGTLYTLGPINVLASATPSVISADINMKSTVTVSVASGASALFSGTVQSNPYNGGLTKSGLGTLTLSGTNTYPGGTTINGGILNVNADAALGNSAGTVAISNGATLQAAGTVTTSARTLTLGAGGGVIDTNSNVVNFNSGSTVTGIALTKTGAGTLNFGVNSDLTGLVALAANNGTTNVNSILGSGASTVSVTGATTLKFGSVSQTLSSLTIGAGSTVVFTSGFASFSGGGGKGTSLGGTTTVPEPGTLGLLLVGALGVLNRRRRQA